MRKPASGPKAGRPEKFKGGGAILNVSVRPDVAENLRRFMGYLVSVDGVRRSQGDVLTEALEAFRPFREWKKGQKGAPG
jgi:hypothetical protein